MDNITGKFGCRREPYPAHWPRKTTALSLARCQLHNWATDLEERPNVYLCSVCNVHLCMECFKKFHTTEDLVAKKKEICKDLLDKKKKQKKVNTPEK